MKTPGPLFFPPGVLRPAKIPPGVLRPAKIPPGVLRPAKIPPGVLRPFSLRGFCRSPDTRFSNPPRSRTLCLCRFRCHSLRRQQANGYGRDNGNDDDKENEIVRIIARRGGGLPDCSNRARLRNENPPNQ